MNTKALMISSAIMMGLLGIAFSFLPQEILFYFAITANENAAFILQLTGALYLAFAMVNWMSRGNILGGIYGRPIIMGNFVHFTIGALALLKGLFNASHTRVELVIAAIVYAVLAVLFRIASTKHPK